MHGKVFVDEWGEIIVAFPANEALKAAIRTIPTAHYDFYECRGWQIWPSERTIPTELALSRQFNLVIDPTLHGSPADLVAHFNSARYAASQASRPATLFKVPLPGLTASQHAGIQYTVRAMRCWIADEDEQDRQAIALGTLQAANAVPAIIVCPANYNDAWKRALENYLPDKKLLDARSNSTKQPTDLVLINYEALDGTDIALQALNRRPYSLILDEAHYVKNPYAQRTRRFSLCRKASTTGCYLQPPLSSTGHMS